MTPRSSSLSWRMLPILVQVPAMTMFFPLESTPSYPEPPLGLEKALVSLSAKAPTRLWAANLPREFRTANLAVLAQRQRLRRSMQSRC